MGKKNKRPEYVIICREFNRAAARIDITVIDKTLGGKENEHFSKNKKWNADIGSSSDRCRIGIAVFPCYNHKNDCVYRSGNAALYGNRTGHRLLPL